MSFQKVLRHQMHEKNMSAAQLSKQSGVSEASLSEYLNGKKEPMAKTLSKIAKALNVSVDVLLETEYSGLQSNAYDGLSPVKSEFFKYAATLDDTMIQLLSEIAHTMMRQRGK